MQNKKHEKFFIISIFTLFIIFLSLFIKDCKGPQLNIFFRRDVDYMADFYNTAKYSVSNNPYMYKVVNPPIIAESQYPPFANLIFHFIGRCGNYSTPLNFPDNRSSTALLTSSLFMFFTSLMFFLSLYEGYKGEKIYKVLITLSLFLSSIFLFSFERGNIILLAAACCAFFVFNYKSENKFVRELSYISLAVAVNLKLYPALLGILLLYDKNYKEACRTFIYSLILFITPLFFFEGGLHNIPLMLKNQQANISLGGGAITPRFNFRLWASYLYFDPINQAMIYNIFGKAEIILGALALASNSFFKTHWKRVMQLILVFSVLLVNSFEYTGLYMFIGIILYFNTQKHEKYDWVYVFLFILLLNPLRIILCNLDLSTFLMSYSASIMLIALTLESLILMKRKCLGQITTEEKI